MELVSPIDLEVKTQKKNIVVEANLKGFASKEVEIEIEGNILKIFGTHAEIDKKENEKYPSVGETLREVHFYQSVTLPAPVDIDESHAKLLKNGKLKITLPRTDTGK